LYSLYRYYQRIDRHMDPETGSSPPRAVELKRLANELTLVEFLGRSDSPKVFHNGMTRALVGAFPEPRHHRLDGDALVAEAKRTLDRALCVGVMERFDDFLRLLCFKTGWVPVETMQSRNVDPAPLRPATDDAELPEAVREAVRRDRVIYEYGLQVFERQFNAMSAELLGDDSRSPSSDVASGAALHSLIDDQSRDLLRRHAKANPPTKLVQINMDRAIRGTGWHEREGPGSAGRVYRWTGPLARSTLDVAVARASRYDVRILVNDAMNRDWLARTKVLINGVAASGGGANGGLSVESRVRNWTLGGSVPGSAVGDDQIARITIEVPDTISPKQLDPSNGDSRKKGLAISTVILNGR
jgi:hypothetical protein